jgi:leucyl-tRNA synthetase
MLKKFGSDAIRLYILFKAPVEKSLEWEEDQVIGQIRFLRKLQTLIENEDVKTKKSKNSLDALIQNLNEIIRDFRSNLKNFELNVCVSQLHKYVNLLWEERETDLSNEIEFKKYIEKLLLLMLPFTPNFSKTMFPKLNSKESIDSFEFPKEDESILKNFKTKFQIQVNGKFKGMVEVSPNQSKEEILKIVEESDIYKHLDIKNIKKVVHVTKLINFIVDK